MSWRVRFAALLELHIVFPSIVLCCDFWQFSSFCKCSCQGPPFPENVFALNGMCLETMIIKFLQS